jgi:hypothetical protein
MRNFRHVLFRHKAFKQLLKYSDERNDGVMVFVLMLLKICASSTLTRQGAKQIRQIYLQAQAEANAAAYALRKIASRTDDQEHTDRLLFDAQQIEHAPHLLIDDGPLRMAASVFDFGLFSRQGDKRPFLINCMHAVLPLSIPNRNALIRDLLELIGISANSHLVRSTIKKSLT